MTQRNHVASLDLLRGVASLSVAMFHFTNGIPGFLAPGFLKTVGGAGWVGVEAFFVISGFIIPFALGRAGYRIADYFRFLLKRVIRLDPPYIASIALLLLLNWLSSQTPWYRGAPVHFTAGQLAAHIGYANAFVGYEWLNPVYWTLAIEAQYYLLLGLVFPLLASRRVFVWGATVAVLACAPVLFGTEDTIFRWLLLFCLGILIFQLRRGAASLKLVLIGTGVLTAACVVVYGAFVASIAFATAMVIAFCRGSIPRPAAFFGKISYSLYLVHAPVGGKIVSLGARVCETDVQRVLVLATAFAASTAAAWVFYRYIEQPAQRWSSAIAYRRQVVAPSGFGPRAG